MRLRPIAGIVLRQWYLIRGSPVRVLPMFAWVAIDIVLWGFITRYLNAVSASGINFVSTLLGAVLLWDLFTRIMQGISTAFLEDVWSRNFLNLFATPLRISEYVTWLVLTSLATSTVGLLTMLVLATAVSVVGTVIVPRKSGSRLTRLVASAAHGIFRLILLPVTSYRWRDRIRRVYLRFMLLAVLPERAP